MHPYDDEPCVERACTAGGLLTHAECGTPLTAQSPASPAVPSPSPLSYTPGYLAEKILTSKTSLEGERKQATVLFADLKDSTELIRILHLWRDLGVLAAEIEIPVPGRVSRLADDHTVHDLNAETSGLFMPTVEHWINVHADEFLGRIVSPYGGQMLSEVRSPVDGILLTLREDPLVSEGSLMARIMATDTVGEAPQRSTGPVHEAQDAEG